jgi:hypothetical protein
MVTRLIPIVFVLAAGFPSQEPAPKEERPYAEPYVERSQRQFSFYPGGKLELVAGMPGNIRIIGWKRASVLIEIERIVRDLPVEQAKDLSDHFPLQVRYNQTSARIRTSGPPQSPGLMETSLTLYVPQEKTDLNLRILKGNLAMGALNGWVEADLQEGSVEAKSLQGYFSAVTRRGDLAVEMSGSHWNGLGFTATTQHGSVALLLPVHYSAALQLETRDGTLTIDYPEQLVEGESVPLQAATKKNARSLSATVGDGGSAIKLLTHAGDIRLTKLPSP